MWFYATIEAKYKQARALKALNLKASTGTADWQCLRFKVLVLQHILEMHLFINGKHHQRELKLHTIFHMLC